MNRAERNKNKGEKVHKHRIDGTAYKSLLPAFNTLAHIVGSLIFAIHTTIYCAFYAQRPLTPQYMVTAGIEKFA